jgi:hypothetical protein
MTINATKKKIITPTRFPNAPKLPPPVDVDPLLAGAVVGATVAFTVAVAAATMSWMP